MKIKLIGEPKTIMSNPHSRYNYFAWPTAARLKNGKIAVVASGYRLRHVCPFGKTVISFSEDEGETYSLPSPVIDTPLDDRDGGIVAFGKSGVLVTSFNNPKEIYRKYCEGDGVSSAYLDSLTDADEQKYGGSLYRISYDNGYKEGYTKGVADSLGKAQIVYSYHQHVGNSGQAGGCYGNLTGTSVIQCGCNSYAYDKDEKGHTRCGNCGHNHFRSPAVYLLLRYLFQLVLLF